MSSSSTSQLRPSSSSLTIPAVIAYSAAVLLAAASTTANVSAAISKHTTLSGQFIAGSVAVAVAALVLIALPAAITAFKARQFVASIIAALVFTLAATYSTTSAIGILAKPRIESAYRETDAKQNRENLRADRKRASEELAKLAPARSSAELSPMIAAKLATPGAMGCTTVNGPISMRVCSEVEAMRAESARADRIGTLTATITRADKGLADAGSMKVENADAAALTAVLAVFGLIVDVNTLNVALMILAVVILETGSGLSLAIAQSMRVAMPVTPSMKDITPNAHSLPVEPVASVPAIFTPAATSTLPAPSQTVQNAADKIITLVKNAGGELRVASKRELARAVDVSHPTVGRALTALAGVVIVANEAGEIVVKLAA